MPPPLAPEEDWALNSSHDATTLLEDGTDDPAVAAEGLAAYWQAAQVGRRVGAEALAGDAVAGAWEALEELVRRVRAVGEPTPFEVALPRSSSARGGDDTSGDDPADDSALRMRAVVAAVMSDARALFADERIIEAGEAWEHVAARAQELGAESLRGVARHHLGRLLLRLRSPEPGDAATARLELESAALLIDPGLHPWAWRRNEEELERLWRARSESPGSMEPGPPDV